MNPLIKEFASKVLKWPDTDNDGLTVFDNDELEKFAELIVKDCAEQALKKGMASPDTDFRTGSFLISEYLLARYGVEE